MRQLSYEQRRYSPKSRTPSDGRNVQFGWRHTAQQPSTATTHWVADSPAYSARLNAGTDDQESVTINLPNQHVMVLSPIPAGATAGTYGSGTQAWLNYQTPDTGYTSPLPKKYSDPYAAALAGQIGVGIRWATITSTFKSANSVDDSASGSDALFKTEYGDSSATALSWPEALIHAGGGVGATGAIWCRGNSSTGTSTSDITVYGDQSPEHCLNAPLPVLVPANPNWAAAAANNVRASPADCLNPWGLGAQCNTSYSLNYGASIWGVGCRGAGAGCAPTSSLENCGVHYPVGPTGLWGGCVMDPVIATHWSQKLQPNGDDLSITAGRLAAMIRPLGVVNWDGSSLGYDGKNVIIVLQSSWLAASFYGCRSDTECGKMPKHQNMIGPGSSLGPASYDPSTGDRPNFRTSIGVIGGVLENVIDNAQSASPSSVNVTHYDPPTGLDCIQPVSSIETLWSGAAPAVISYAAFIAVVPNKKGFLPWSSDSGQKYILVTLAIPNTDTNDGSNPSWNSTDISQIPLLNPGRPETVTNMGTSASDSSSLLGSAVFICPPVLVDVRGTVYAFILAKSNGTASDVNICSYSISPEGEPGAKQSSLMSELSGASMIGQMCVTQQPATGTNSFGQALAIPFCKNNVWKLLLCAIDQSGKCAPVRGALFDIPTPNGVTAKLGGGSIIPGPVHTASVSHNLPHEPYTDGAGYGGTGGTGWVGQNNKFHSISDGAAINTEVWNYYTAKMVHDGKNGKEVSCVGVPIVLQCDSGAIKGATCTGGFSGTNPYWIKENRVSRNLGDEYSGDLYSFGAVSASAEIGGASKTCLTQPRPTMPDFHPWIQSLTQPSPAYDTTVDTTVASSSSSLLDDSNTSLPCAIGLESPGWAGLPWSEKIEDGSGKKATPLYDIDLPLGDASSVPVWPPLTSIQINADVAGVWNYNPMLTGGSAFYVKPTTKTAENGDTGSFTGSLNWKTITWGGSTVSLDYNNSFLYGGHGGAGTLVQCSPRYGDDDNGDDLTVWKDKWGWRRLGHAYTRDNYKNGGAAIHIKYRADTASFPLSGLAGLNTSIYQAAGDRPQQLDAVHAANNSDSNLPSPVGTSKSRWVRAFTKSKSCPSCGSPQLSAPPVSFSDDFGTSIVDSFDLVKTPSWYWALPQKTNYVPWEYYNPNECNNNRVYTDGVYAWSGYQPYMSSVFISDSRATEISNGCTVGGLTLMDKPDLKSRWDPGLTCTPVGSTYALPSTFTGALSGTTFSNSIDGGHVEYEFPGHLLPNGAGAGLMSVTRPSTFAKANREHKWPRAWSPCSSSLCVGSNDPVEFVPPQELAGEPHTDCCLCATGMNRSLIDKNQRKQCSGACTYNYSYAPQIQRILTGIVGLSAGLSTISGNTYPVFTVYQGTGMGPISATGFNVSMGPLDGCTNGCFVPSTGTTGSSGANICQLDCSGPAGGNRFTNGVSGFVCGSGPSGLPSPPTKTVWSETDQAYAWSAPLWPCVDDKCSYGYLTGLSSGMTTTSSATGSAEIKITELNEMKVTSIPDAAQGKQTSGWTGKFYNYGAGSEATGIVGITYTGADWTGAFSAFNNKQCTGPGITQCPLAIKVVADGSATTLCSPAAGDTSCYDWYAAQNIDLSPPEEAYTEHVPFKIVQGDINNSTWPSNDNPVPYPWVYGEGYTDDPGETGTAARNAAMTGSVYTLSGAAGGATSLTSWKEWHVAPQQSGTAGDQANFSCNASNGCTGSASEPKPLPENTFSNPFVDMVNGDVDKCSPPTSPRYWPAPYGYEANRLLIPSGCWCRLGESDITNRPGFGPYTYTNVTAADNTFKPIVPISNTCERTGFLPMIRSYCAPVYKWATIAGATMPHMPHSTGSGTIPPATGTVQQDFQLGWRDQDVISEHGGGTDSARIYWGPFKTTAASTKVSRWAPRIVGVSNPYPGIAYVGKAAKNQEDYTTNEMAPPSQRPLYALSLYLTGWTGSANDIALTTIPNDWTKLDDSDYGLATSLKNANVSPSLSALDSDSRIISPYATFQLYQVPMVCAIACPAETDTSFCIRVMRACDGIICAEIPVKMTNVSNISSRKLGLMASSLTVTAVPAGATGSRKPTYWGNRPIVEPAYDAYPDAKNSVNSKAENINVSSTSNGPSPPLGQAVHDSNIWSGPRCAKEQWDDRDVSLGMAEDHDGAWSIWRVTWTNQHGGVTGTDEISAQNISGRIMSGILISSRTCAALPQSSVPGYGARWWAFENEVKVNAFGCTAMNKSSSYQLYCTAGPRGLTDITAGETFGATNTLAAMAWPEGVTAAGGCGGMTYVPPMPHNENPVYDGTYSHRSGGGAPAYALTAMAANHDLSCGISAGPSSLTAGASGWTHGPLNGGLTEAGCTACRPVTALSGCGPPGTYAANCGPFPVGLKHSWSNTILIAGSIPSAPKATFDESASTDWSGTGPSQEIIQNTDFVPQGTRACAGGSCPTWP